MPQRPINAEDAQPLAPITIGAPKTNVGKTLAGMEARLSVMLGGRDDLSVELLREWINDAYLDLWTSIPIEEANGSLEFPVIGGQPLYLLPYQVSTIRAASIVGEGWFGQANRPLHKSDLYHYRELPDRTNQPNYFLRISDVLVLWPTPDKTYTVGLDFRTRPLPLVEPTDSPALDPEWHEAILLSARKKGFADLQEFDKALPAENDFVNTVRRRQDREAREDEGRIVGSSVPHKTGGRLKWGRRSPEPE